MIYKLALASDRRKEPEKYLYRRMTSAEARAITHEWFEFCGKDGKVRRARRSGRLKTWKTRPNDYRLPVKYGLYESSALVPDPSAPEFAAFENSGGAFPVMRTDDEVNT